MTRRTFSLLALAAFCLAAFAQPSSASVTFRIENVDLAAGSTSGFFNVFIDVDDVGTADSGVNVTSFNISAGLGAGGTLGGGGGPASVTIGAPLQPTNALVPFGPTPSLLTPSAFRVSVIEPTGTIFYPAAATVQGPKRLVRVPFTLANAALPGESIPLVFNDLTSPFNTMTGDILGFRTNLASVTPVGTILLQNGSITVAAVPEPGSMFAIGSLCVAGGVRHCRKKRRKV